MEQCPFNIIQPLFAMPMAKGITVHRRMDMLQAFTVTCMVKRRINIIQALFT